MPVPMPGPCWEIHEAKVHQATSGGMPEHDSCLAPHVARLKLQGLGQMAARSIFLLGLIGTLNAGASRDLIEEFDIRRHEHCDVCPYRHDSSFRVQTFRLRRSSCTYASTRSRVRSRAILSHFGLRRVFVVRLSL